MSGNQNTLNLILKQNSVKESTKYQFLIYTSKVPYITEMLSTCFPTTPLYFIISLVFDSCHSCSGSFRDLTALMDLLSMRVWVKMLLEGVGLPVTVLIGRLWIVFTPVTSFQHRNEPLSQEHLETQGTPGFQLHLSPVSLGFSLSKTGLV